MLVSTRMNLDQSELVLMKKYEERKLLHDNDFLHSLLDIEWLFTGASHINQVQTPSIILTHLSYTEAYDFNLLCPDNRPPPPP
jgi:hypothetical protein